MKASILMSILNLMLLVSVVSLPSPVSSSSFIVLMKNFFYTNGADVAMLLMAWGFWAMISHIGACTRHMAILLDMVPPMLPLWG